MNISSPNPTLAVEIARELSRGELADLYHAAVLAIEAGGGFGWVTPPSQDVMEAYWKGVLLIPERSLILARLDGVICGSAQLVKPARNNEAQAHSASLTTSFIAPWARGHGLARMVILAAEECAKTIGIRVINLDVRETQSAAIALYRSLGYQEIGRHPYYARIDNGYVAGLYFCKEISDNDVPASEEPRSVFSLAEQNS